METTPVPYVVLDAEVWRGRRLPSGRYLFHPPGYEPAVGTFSDRDVYLEAEEFEARVRCLVAGYDADDPLVADIALALAGAHSGVAA